MTDPNLLCLHCGELLTPQPPWLHCTACAHAYLPGDLEKAHQQRQAARDRADILETLREQNRRRNSKSSSDGGPSKEDKLGSRTQRQANWGDDDGGTFLSWSKAEPKTEYLSVRGLPESVPVEAVMAAIEMELESGNDNKLSLKEVQDAIKRLQAMPAKYVIMSTDKDGNPIITELPAIDPATSIDTTTDPV